VTTQRIDEHIAADRPGVGMLRAAVFIIVIGTIGGTMAEQKGTD
jgi:hypothetical protein